MRVRRLAPPDRDAVLALFRSDATFHDDEVAVAMELCDSAANAPGRDYSALVAVEGDGNGDGGAGDGGAGEGGQIVGYVCYGRTPMTDATWDLYWIGTHSAARGRGIATRLFAVLEEELRRESARLIRIETSQLEAYGSARGLYDRLGFAEVGRIADFYRVGDDLIIMTRRFAADGGPLATRATDG